MVGVLIDDNMHHTRCP